VVDAKKKPYLPHGVTIPYLTYRLPIPYLTYRLGIPYLPHGVTIPYFFYGVTIPYSSYGVCGEEEEETRGPAMAEETDRERFDFVFEKKKKNRCGRLRVFPIDRKRFDSSPEGGRRKRPGHVLQYGRPRRRNLWAGPRKTHR
jgi:hypothetical protein